jgi:hypothetical protein
MVKKSRTKFPTFEASREGGNEDLQMCLIHRDFKHFAGAKAINFGKAAQDLVNHASQGVVNHAPRRSAVERRLTSLFKRIRRAPWHALTHRPGT